MGALNGIRVLDLSRVLAGPWCGQILADLGAEVIKIERPKVGDDTRSWGPPWMKDDSGQDTQEAAYYQSTNRNKLSVAIDIANPEGQELIKALIQDTDVVIENYKAGSLKSTVWTTSLYLQLTLNWCIAQLQVLVKLVPEQRNPVMTLLFRGWADSCRSRVSVMICPAVDHKK